MFLPLIYASLDRLSAALCSEFMLSVDLKATVNDELASYLVLSAQSATKDYIETEGDYLREMYS